MQSWYHPCRFLEVAHSIASAISVSRWLGSILQESLLATSGIMISGGGEANPVDSDPSPRKVRAVTTSLIDGRIVASSCRHMEATATA